VTGRRSGSTCATTARRWSCPGAAARTCWSSCGTSTSSARPRCTPRRRAPSSASRRRRRRARDRSGRPGAASTRSWAAFEERGGALAVRLYLRDMAYEKKRRRRHPKQAKLHQEHHQSPAAAVVPLTSLATESRGGVLEPVAPHFLFPHAHFFPGVGGVTGEDVAMAEAHAAG
jgi:hypothetical protein